MGLYLNPVESICMQTGRNLVVSPTKKSNDGVDADDASQAKPTRKQVELKLCVQPET